MANIDTQREGSRGPPVFELQLLLISKGFDAGRVDGVFGAKTKAAVVAFQRAKGLAADGVVGPKTWAQLRSSGGGGGHGRAI